MAPKVREGDAVVALSGKWISWAHTAFAYSAFIGALVTGLFLHYHKIVENEYYVHQSLVISFRVVAYQSRDTPKNGSLQSLLRLETAIPNAPFFNSSSP